MLLTLWLLTAAADPTVPPLVPAPDAPRPVVLTPGERDRLVTRRAELIAQMPPMTGPISATVGSGVLIVGGVVTLLVSFIESFFSKPCSGIACINLGFDAGRATAGYIAGVLFTAAGATTLPFSVRMLTRTARERSALAADVDELDAQLNPVTP